MQESRNTHHDCPMCGRPTQTSNDGACVPCKQRINEQIKRYLPVAEIFTLNIGDAGAFGPGMK